MGYLTQVLKRSTAYGGAELALRQRRSPVLISGPAQVHKAHLCASLCANLGKKPLFVAADETQAAIARSDLERLLGDEVLLFPYKDLVLYHVEGASHDFGNARIETLLRIRAGDYGGVVTTMDALCQLTIPPEALASHIHSLKVGQTIPMEELLGALVDAGYERCDMVEGPGQFAQRGGIVDFFPPQEKEPVRVELFGDDVDLIGHFDVESQRRTDNVDSATLSPAVEVTMTARQRRELGELLRSLIAKYRKSKRENAQQIVENLQGDLDRLEAQGTLANIEKYAPSVYGRKSGLLDYMQDCMVFLSEEMRLKERLDSTLWQLGEDLSACLDRGVLCPELTELYFDEGEILSALGKMSCVLLDTLMPSRPLLPPAELISLSAKQMPSAVHGLEVLLEDLRHYLETGFEVLILCENEKKAKNLQELLRDKGVPAAFSPEPAATAGVNITVTVGSLSASFEYPEIKFALLCDSVGQVRDRASKRRKKNAGERIHSFDDLHIGDLVVHTNHGIGRYMGIVPLTVQDVTKDYIKIQYAGQDVLYVPCHQLDLISKYIAGDKAEGAVKLNRMGGTEWARTKQRVRSMAKDMAKQLIKLYAERQKVQGYAFPADTEWQKEFEDRFEYEETEDQLRCTAEIKADMERSIPMDRLLCGDVGFGKTEVALRAAFKCVAEGKQAAILVPTTILAWQHYETVKKRIYPYPVKVEILSRFRTPKQQQEIVRQLTRGEVDIVIGTHRMVQKDVKFRDLGLLIVDEEQRFGVAHKERLKELFQAVDVLTLSATPIPRTLNMALTGIRDMSVIEEAPRDRQAVQTYVMEYDTGVITDAIRKELRRGGQVFYLHNRTESLERAAARIKQMVPEANVAFAHGQMKEGELSDIWETVVSGEVNVLVCTTIIETGVDVPNANTLIIEDADRLGLAQLHQIRGRVGRSARRAYAYFTYRKGKVLSEDATKRLSTIREFTEFGSGFKIAMRDLEIRGAGNVLGAEQHGQMEAVGYDMYLKILEEAVSEEKGERPKQQTECLVDMFVDTHIPEQYIPSPMVRIEIYKKIAAVGDEEHRADLTDELIDRFGDLPRAVENLLTISLIRNMAGRMGISEISQKDRYVLFTVLNVPFEKVAEAVAALGGRLLYNAGSKPYLSYKLEKNEGVLEAADRCLRKIYPILVDNGGAAVV